MLISASSADAEKGSDGSSSALFKPHTETTSVSVFHEVNNQMLHKNGSSMGDDSGIHDSLDGTRMEYILTLELQEQLKLVTIGENMDRNRSRVVNILGASISVPIQTVQ